MMKSKSFAVRMLFLLVLVFMLTLPGLAAAQEPEPNDPPPEALPVDPEPPIPLVSFVESTVVPGVVPDSVSDVLGVGTSLVVEKTVTLPEVPPRLDLVLMVDLSGSYNNDLPNIKSKAPNIFTGVRNEVADSQFGLTTFVDYPFLFWGNPSWDYAYNLDQDLTADQSTWLSAVYAMSTRSGADGPESQYAALYQAATGAGQTVDGYTIPAGADPSWRDNVTHVIAITTDAPFHNAGDGGGPFPYPGPTRDATVAALNAENIKVIAIKAPGASLQMDDIANATGGAVTFTGNTSEEIVEAILGALEELTFTVTPVPVGCDPLQLTFNPASHADVMGGDSVVFEETIAVPADATPGIYNCQVEFYADETLIGSEAISIVVYDPSAGFVTGGGWIDSPAGAYKVHPFLSNAGFETDDLSAWSMSIPPGGFATVTTSAVSQPPFGGTINYSAQDGEYFAYMKTNGPGSYTTLSQSFVVTEGDTISGWAFFDTTDYLPFNDNAMVRILDSGNNTIAEPFYADVALVGDYGQTPWTYWEHTFAIAGTYTVEARVANALDSVVDSYMGLDIVVSTLAGKANFGFVSKYKKGAETPTGNTEFQFHAADLNFHSNNYEWLVVTGSDFARFKGVGTVNGEGAYKFMLWAGDDEPDTFRIRIWTEDEVTAAETVLYDNGFDQAIGGGSIIIHTKK